MLARLIARTKDRTDADSADAAKTLTQAWERAREQASSAAELAEIDAIFGRHAA